MTELRGPVSRTKSAATRGADYLRLAAAMFDRSWDGSIGCWVSADEVATALGGVDTAQFIGGQLAVWERRGLVESKQEDWGKMWRPCAALRELVGGGL